MAELRARALGGFTTLWRRWLGMVWPSVPEPIDAATYRRGFSLWWIYVLLATMNLAACTRYRTQGMYNPAALSAFLTLNLPVLGTAVALCLVGRHFDWSERTLRRLTYGLLLVDVLAALGALWVAGGTIPQFASNAATVWLVIAWTRAFYDARIGLASLLASITLTSALFVAEGLGLVPSPMLGSATLAAPAVDPMWSAPDGKLLIIVWLDVMSVVIWVMTSLAVKRVRETDWALATERAARRRLEARMRDRADGARSGASIDRYALGELLGAGAMGEVYAARDAEGDGNVAVKVLHAHLATSSVMMERFRRESEILTRLPEAFVARLFDQGFTEDGAPYLVMERLRGEDLATHLRRVDRLALADALPVVRALALALDAAHARGVVHRDLKPQNVFLCEGKEGAASLRLLDFGISRLMGDDHGPLTRPAWVLGSPGYLAPEQARGDHDRVGPASDVFALGAIVYRMLTGLPAFPARDMASAIVEAQHATPPPPGERVPGLPAQIDAVIALALAKPLELRYARAGDFVRDLERAAAGALPANVVERASRVALTRQEPRTLTEDHAA